MVPPTFLMSPPAMFPLPRITATMISELPSQSAPLPFPLWERLSATHPVSPSAKNASSSGADRDGRWPPRRDPPSTAHAPGTSASSAMQSRYTQKTSWLVPACRAALASTWKAPVFTCQAKRAGGPTRGGGGRSKAVGSGPSLERFDSPARKDWPQPEGGRERNGFHSNTRFRERREQYNAFASPTVCAISAGSQL